MQKHLYQKNSLKPYQNKTKIENNSHTQKEQSQQMHKFYT